MMTWILIIGGVLVLVLLIVGVVVSANSERSLVEERLGQYLDEDKPEVEDGGDERSAITDWINQRVSRSSLGDRIARDLARADLKLKGA